MTTYPEGFILSESESMDVTADQAAALVAAELIYQPEEGPDANLHYYTCPWDVTLDDVERFLRDDLCAECKDEDHPTCSLDATCVCCRDTIEQMA